jgi:hypothetical protein
MDHRKLNDWIRALFSVMGGFMIMFGLFLCLALFECARIDPTMSGVAYWTIIARTLLDPGDGLWGTLCATTLVGWGFLLIAFGIHGRYPTFRWLRSANQRDTSHPFDNVPADVTMSQPVPSSSVQPIRAATTRMTHFVEPVHSGKTCMAVMWLLRRSPR